VGRRSNNEDAFCVEPGLGLFAVADGMGGHEGGEVASHLVVDALREVFASAGHSGEITWPVRGARRRARRAGSLAQMGSTVVALAVRPGGAAVAHLGDSRLYRLRRGALAQMTRDHSLYAELAAASPESLPPRERFPHGNIITRAVGAAGDGAPEVAALAIEPGDSYLLCSDGLSEPVPPARLAELLAWRSASEACVALVQEAYRRGGRDNITAVVVRVLG
jgi:serine/threonine protein phosphatase PrpC